MDKGGAESRTMDIFREIDKTEIMFDFMETKAGEHHFSKEIVSLGGKIYTVSNPRHFLRHIKDMNKLFKGPCKDHIVHTHLSQYSGLIALVAKMSGIKTVVVHSRTANDKNMKTIKRRIYKKIMQFFIKVFADARITCGTEAGYYLFGKKEIEKGRVIYLPNAINLSLYEDIQLDKSEIKESLNINKEAIVLGHIGRFNDVKNHNFLIKVFFEYNKTNKNSYLILIGDGDLFNDIKKQVEGLGISKNVIFLGVRNDINIITHIFDIFILPSFYEGVPGVVIEAQACGVPCLISSTITKDLITGTESIYYKSLEEDAYKWANKIDEILKTKDSLKTKGQHIKCLKEKSFDVKATSQKLYDVYKHIYKKRG
ncbi:MAG: glycosyltransferase [Oscillospiraceae bacterium]